MNARVKGIGATLLILDSLLVILPAARTAAAPLRPGDILVAEAGGPFKAIFRVDPTTGGGGKAAVLEVKGFEGRAWGPMGGSP